MSLMDFHGAACDRIGFVRDTDAWRNCVLQQYQQAENRKMDEKMEVANRQRAAGTMGMQMQQKNRPMICRWVGKTMDCN